MRQIPVKNALVAGLLAALAMHGQLNAASNAHAAGLGDMNAGMTYAQRRCTECHDISARNPMNTATGAPTFHEIANTPGISRTSLSSWLLSSHPKMPGLMIEPADLDNVIAFILSLKDE